MHSILTTSSKLLLLALLCGTMVPAVLAQPGLFKQGKVSRKEAALTVCGYDTLAPAVVLGKAGELSFGSGPSVTIAVQKRLKILKQKGLRYACLRIPFGKTDPSEKITGVTAGTINFQGKKDTWTGVPPDSIKVVHNSGGQSFVEIKFPDAQQGSVLDLQYLRTAYSIEYIEAWQFHEELPVLASEFKMKIPDGYAYTLQLQGNIKEQQQYAMQPRWLLENLPPLRPGPWQPDPEKQAARINMLLAGMYIKNSGGGVGFKDITRNWEYLAKKQLKEPEYCALLDANASVGRLAASMEIKKEMTRQNLEKVYRQVATIFAWNGQCSSKPSGNAEQLLKLKRGNSADINLLLVTLLRHAGIHAHPALIRTSNTGPVDPDFWYIGQFNQVLCYVEVEGQRYFLDATDPYRPVSLPGLHNHAEQALILSQRRPRFVETRLQPGGVTDYLVTCDLAAPEKSVYYFRKSSNGYVALQERHALQTNRQAFLQQQPGYCQPKVQITAAEVQQLNSIEQPLVLTMRYVAASNFTESNLLEILPFSALENALPEALPQRQRFYPLDFTKLADVNFRFVLKLPAGLKPGRVPASRRLNLPDGGGYFAVSTSQTAGSVEFLVQLQLLKHKFAAADGPALVQVFNEMREIIQEPLVLQKQ